MKRLPWSLFWRWFTQEREAALAWVKMKGASPQGLEAYEAGFEQGFGKCRSLLQLHGYLSVDEGK